MAQLGDSVVAVFSDSELLQKVPFVSHIAKAFALKEAYHLHRLARNCRAFLESAKEGDTSNLGDRLCRAINDPNRLWEIEDTMLEILIEGEKPLKAEILGRLLRALAVKDISYEQFDVTSLLVLSGSVPALKAVPTFFEISDGKRFLHSRDLGRTEPLLTSLGIASRYGTKLEVSEVGLLLYRFGFLPSP